MAKIAIDADGVLADFTRAFIETANMIGLGPLDPEYQPPSWNFPLLHKDDINRVFEAIKKTENFWVYLRAFPDNVGAFANFMLTEKGHDIYIVTSRMHTKGMTTAMQTDIWLKVCGIRPVHNYLGVIPVDDSDRKVDIYDVMGVQYSVDDKTETVEQCDRLKGHKAFLLDRAWNQDAKVVRRIDSLMPFFRAIREKK